MSETLADQLADLRRLKAAWEDDPQQRTPFPHEAVLAAMEEMADAADAKRPPVRAADVAARIARSAPKRRRR